MGGKHFYQRHQRSHQHGWHRHGWHYHHSQMFQGPRFFRPRLGIWSLLPLIGIALLVFGFLPWWLMFAAFGMLFWGFGSACGSSFCEESAEARDEISKAKRKNDEKPKRGGFRAADGSTMQIVDDDGPVQV